MTTDYDPIAEQYKRSKQQPWRTYIECFTLTLQNHLFADHSPRLPDDLAARCSTQAACFLWPCSPCGRQRQKTADRAIQAAAPKTT